MQQAIYNNVTVKTTVRSITPTASRPGLARHFARCWDLYGVLTLMASSAVYAFAALAHLA